MFQFLIGRLQTAPAKQAVKTSQIAFQFLIGRLQTGYFTMAQNHRTAFQFLIGRLQTLPFPLDSVTGVAVSIPHR